MEVVKKVMVKVVVWSVSVMVSVVVGLGLVWKRVREGPQVFYIKPRPTPPSILSDPKWGTHAYMHLKSSGLKLHYVEAGDRSKPLMVFIHGFPECWFSWRHQLTHFAQSHWVVAVDMRGYGDSDKPAATSQYSMDLLVEDLRFFIQALGQERCVLVAHDWGAVLAWQLVTYYPDMFSAHVSCNGPHSIAFKKHLRQSFKQLFMSWYIFFFQMPWLPELILKTNDLQMFNKMFKMDKEADASIDDTIEAYKYYFSQKGALTPPINYYRNINFGDSSNMPRVQVPTLIVWGTEDKALNKPIAIMSATECTTAEVKFVEGAGHFVQQEQPRAVNTHIQKFLDQLPSTLTTY